MAIPEACQVWIEQRISEELESQEETGKSLRAIGRELAEEVEKVFDVAMKPGTLQVRASRMKQRDTNVSPLTTLQSDNEIPENSSFLEESSCPSGEPPTATHGGKREGAGKPMTEKQRKANYNSVWMGVAQRMNSLAEHMSSKGQYPIKENAKPRTVGELNDALNLLNQILRRIRT